MRLFDVLLRVYFALVATALISLLILKLASGDGGGGRECKQWMTVPVGKSFMMVCSEWEEPVEPALDKRY